jgi:methylenetetrahydrofolate dehydrogenase (NADP+) / methenyltetrahydrofolate cyclohydrolase
MIAGGKMVAKKMEESLKKKMENIPQKKTCFVMFGENPASVQFVGMKTRVADRLGILADVKKFSADVSQGEAVSKISEIISEGYDGIVIQLPLPDQLDAQAVLNCVPPELDVDVLGDGAKELFARGDLRRIPPVARAVSEILDFYQVSLDNKKIVVVGNGKLVGMPIAAMLGLKKVPFQIIDKNTSEDVILSCLKSADIVISGAGSPCLVKPEMVKDGVVLIDAGTSEQAGKLVGDIDPACAEKASLMTPVPGGVGPVTVACLFANLLES